MVGDAHGAVRDHCGAERLIGLAESPRGLVSGQVDSGTPRTSHCHGMKGAKRYVMRDQNELDGVWDVQRTSGALPPMRGIVRKRIGNGRGRTIAFGVSLPFGVEGLTLRYPLGLVDELVPDGADAYNGTTKLFGRVVGTFRLTRASDR